MLTVSFPHAQLRDACSELPDGVESLLWGFETDPPRPEIDLVILPFVDPREYRRLTGVRTRLVQAQSIGYDHITPVLPEGHRLANGTTIHETATAEIALALVLAGQRDLGTHLRNQGRGVWRSTPAPGLADKRVLILGYGAIGREIEERLVPFGVADVIRVARTARSVDGKAVHPLAELHRLLRHVDVLIVAASLNPSSVDLVDAPVLRALPDGALVVNIARGRVVDQPALLAELAAGRLRAALDVTDPEPLPADHPLWRLPNAIITPHVGGDTDALHPRRSALIRRQIQHLLGGREPENVVLDQRAGFVVAEG